MNHMLHSLPKSGLFKSVHWLGYGVDDRGFTLCRAEFLATKSRPYLCCPLSLLSSVYQGYLLGHKQLTTHLYIVPELGMRGVLSQRPPYVWDKFMILSLAVRNETTRIFPNNESPSRHIGGWEKICISFHVAAE